MIVHLTTIVLFIIGILPCFGLDKQTDNTIQPSPIINGQQYIHELSPPEQSFFKSLKNLTQTFFSRSFSSNNSDSCLQSLNQIKQDLLSFQLDALRLVDSWGKLESGYFQANTRWMGRYYECKEVKTDLFKGEYFPAVFQLQIKTLPIQVQIGTCFPDTCTEDNVTSLLTAVLQYIHANATVNVTRSLETPAKSTNSIIALTVLALVFAITLTATVYDVIITYKKKNSAFEQGIYAVGNFIPETKWQRIILSFSAISNTNKLLSTDRRPGDINCLHGIRFISMCWVMLGHTVLQAANYTDNLLFLARYFINSWAFEAVTNATFSVDTFFLLSGLLTAYLGMRELNRSDGRFNVFVMYLYRYIRLTPAYAFAILMLVGVLPIVGTGPVWSSYTKPGVEQCEKYWFTNLLYINNLYPADLTKECFSWGWYLANDMQFYLLAPLILYLLYRYYRVALFLLAFLTVSSMAITGAFSRHTEQQPFVFAMATYAYYLVESLPSGNKLLAEIKPGPAFQLTDTPKYSMYMSDIYAKPWCRIGAYLIGMAFGYLLHVKKNQVKMHKAWAIIGWITAFVVNMEIIYGLYPTIHDTKYLNLDLAAFYNAVSRQVWCVGVGWVVVACTCGYGGYINSFLSWKAFIPLSRLTYCLYLLHLMVLQWLCYTSETLWHLGIQYIILLYCGTVCVTTILAYVMHLMVEAPVIGLLKIFTKKDQLRHQMPPPHINISIRSDENPLLVEENTQEG